MMNHRITYVACYDLTGYLLYGEALRFTLEPNMDRMRMATLRTFFGPCLVLKDGGGVLGEVVYADSTGFSNIRFRPGGLTEIYAYDPPKDTAPMMWDARSTTPTEHHHKEYVIKTATEEPKSQLRSRNRNSLIR